MRVIDNKGQIVDPRLLVITAFVDAYFVVWDRQGPKGVPFPQVEKFPIIVDSFKVINRIRDKPGKLGHIGFFRFSREQGGGLHYVPRAVFKTDAYVLVIGVFKGKGALGLANADDAFAA